MGICPRPAECRPNEDRAAPAAHLLFNDAPDGRHASETDKMAVRIRMKRLGRKHRPFYRICAMDSREKRDGKTIEEFGTYDPMLADKSARVQLDMDRVDYWLGVGAQPTEKVAVLIKKVKKNKFGETKAPPPMTLPKQPEAPAAEAPAEEAPAEDATAEGGEEAKTEDAPAEESAE